MLDRRGKTSCALSDLLPAWHAAGIEHVVDLRAVLHPLLDFVEIAVVRDQRVAGFPFRLRLLGSYFGGRRRMISTLLFSEAYSGVQASKGRQIR